MTTTQQNETAVWEELGITPPPRGEDLPETDGIPLASERQGHQTNLLFEPLYHHYLGQNVYVGKDQAVYYSVEQALNRDFLGPDVYVVLDVDPHERTKWVMWEEGRGLDVVVEIRSPSTAARDRGVKKRIYQDNIGAREYFMWNPETAEFAGFVLHDREYQLLAPTKKGWLPSPTLGLVLRRWDEPYRNRVGPWLRWAFPNGELVPTPEEIERARADAERERAEVERARADTEATRADAEAARADAARARAELAEREAEEARRRQDELEAELRRLRDELGGRQ